MIFIINTEGTVTAAVSSPLYQGSSDVNNIVLLAPFAPSTVVMVTFKLPNGQYVYPYFAKPDGSTSEPYTMTLLDNFSGHFFTEDGKTGYNAWSIKVDYPLTQFPGDLEIRFLLGFAEGTLTSSITMKTIGRGIGYLPPSIADDEALATIYSAIEAAQTARDDAQYYSEEAEAKYNAAANAASDAAESKNAAAQSAAEAEAAMANKLNRIDITATPNGDPGNPSLAYELGKYAAIYAEYYGADGKWRERLLRANNASYANLNEESVQKFIENIMSSRVPITDSAGRLSVAAPQKGANGLFYYYDPNQSAATNNTRNCAIPLWYADERYVRASTYEGDFKALSSALDALNDALSNQGSSTDTDIDALSLRVGALETKTSDLETDIGDISAALDELHGYAVALAGGAV